MIENEIVKREYYFLAIWAFIFSLIPVLSTILTMLFMSFENIPKQITEPWRIINLCILILMPFVSIVTSVVSLITIQKNPDKYYGSWLCIASILISIGVYLFLFTGFFVTKGAHKGPSLLQTNQQAND